METMNDETINGNGRFSVLREANTCLTEASGEAQNIRDDADAARPINADGSDETKV